MQELKGGPESLAGAEPCSIHKNAWITACKQLGLSSRQAVVAHAIFEGLKEYAIAAELGISQATVHTHIRRLYTKLGVHHRAGLVVAVVSQIFRECPNPSCSLYAKPGCHRALHRLPANDLAKTADDRRACVPADRNAIKKTRHG